MNFAERIKARRIELGLSVAQVAKKIGEPASSYIDWENGRKITGEKIYPKLCIALNLTLSELLLGKKSSITEELAKIETSIEKIRLLI